MSCQNKTEHYKGKSCSEIEHVVDTDSLFIGRTNQLIIVHVCVPCWDSENYKQRGKKAPESKTWIESQKANRSSFHERGIIYDTVTQNSSVGRASALKCRGCGFDSHG